MQVYFLQTTKLAYHHRFPVTSLSRSLFAMPSFSDVNKINCDCFWSICHFIFVFSLPKYFEAISIFFFSSISHLFKWSSFVENTLIYILNKLKKIICITMYIDWQAKKNGFPSHVICRPFGFISLRKPIYSKKKINQFDWSI